MFLFFLVKTVFTVVCQKTKNKKKPQINRSIVCPNLCNSVINTEAEVIIIKVLIIMIIKTQEQ